MPTGLVAITNSPNNNVLFRHPTMLRKSLAIAICLLGSTDATRAQNVIGTSARINTPDATAKPLVLVDSGNTSQPGSTTTVRLENQIKGFYLTGALGGNWPQPVNAHLLDSNTGAYGFQDFHNSGVSIEAGAGYDFGDFRAEVTYAYDASSLSSYSDTVAYPSSLSSYSDYTGNTPYTDLGRVAKNSALASLYWDMNLKSRLTPYIGVGIGYSTINAAPTSDGTVDYDAYYGNAFGYQFKAGMSYLVSKRSDIYAEAVYRGMAGFSMYDGSSTYQMGNYNSMGFQLGARVRLGHN